MSARLNIPDRSYWLAVSAPDAIGECIAEAVRHLVRDGQLVDESHLEVYIVAQPDTIMRLRAVMDADHAWGLLDEHPDWQLMVLSVPTPGVRNAALN